MASRFPQANTPPPGGPMPWQEYLALEQQYPYARYEYLNGIARLMAGGRAAHDRIAFNMRVAIDLHFTSGPCSTFGENMKVLVGEKANGAEDRLIPDVTVSCDVDDRRPDNKLVRSPRIVVEVMSPSSEADDRGDKLRAYKACEHIQEIVLISQFAQHVELYRRLNENEEEWTGPLFFGPGESFTLESVDVKIAVVDIYRRVDLAEWKNEEEA
ncbi:MAG TPA: Uma2 family endonuclease [Ktedonobacteraceae bacterium]|nr:Uma2 family endonuclease [Ktedonobacteraceae bacterium]